MPIASCNSRRNVPRHSRCRRESVGLGIREEEGSIMCHCPFIFWAAWVLNGNGKTLMAKLKHVLWRTSFLYNQKDERPYIEENWVPNTLIPIKKLWAGKAAGAECKTVLACVMNTHSLDRLPMFFREQRLELSPLSALPQTLIEGVGLQQ